MKSSATFSDDGKERFDLIRDWSSEISPRHLGSGIANFIMLNPSIAGGKKDDPTIRKGVGFARRWGFWAIVATNLTPTICTDPWSLPHWSGPNHRNAEFLDKWINSADLVVAAWGSPSPAPARRIGFPELVLTVKSLCAAAGKPLYYISTIKGNYPAHPSRAAYTTQPVPWWPRVEDAA